MSFSLSPEDVKKDTAAPRRPYVIGILIWLGVAVVGVLMIMNYGLSERERALLTLQQNLGEVAAARAGDVAAWLAAEKAPLVRFAGDDDVRLNLAQISEPSADLDLGARGYLRNWLADLAQKNGFMPAASAVDANTEAAAPTSLAIIGNDGAVILTIGAFPAGQAEVMRSIMETDKVTPHIIDIFTGAGGPAYLGVVAPIFSLNGGGFENLLGYVVGIKPAAGLYQRLAQPGALYKTSQVLLLRRDGEVGAVVSPLGDKPPLAVTFDIGQDRQVEAMALAAPGGFAEGVDAAGQPAVAASRAVEGSPWVLSYQVAQAEVMSETDQRLLYQMMVFLALLGLVLFFLYGAWKTGAARIAAEKAMEYAGLARKFEFQTRLLRLVTDSQRNHILIADTEGRVRFANATLANSMETTGEDLIGKPLAAAVGPDTARRFGKRGQEASLSNKVVVTVDRIQHEDGTFKVVQTQHIPLEDNSAGPGNTPTRGTLIVEEDITDLVMEREKREKVLKQVVESLVAMVDRRDPYAALHSAHVARVTRAVSTEMNLSDIDADTAEMAGALLNLGKLLVAPEILTKHGPLDEAELKAVRESLLASADAVAGIAFEGPVVESLRQSLEKVDGTGFPEGRKGDDILLTARIVAVANSFVALISARAQRQALPLDEALHILTAQVDRSYDRGVVAALVSYIENKGGRAEWEGEPPPVAVDEDNPFQR